MFENCLNFVPMFKFQLLYILFGLLLKLLKPGGINSIIAENICLRQQLIILSRNKKQCPTLLNTDRLIFGFFSQYINPALSKFSTFLERHQTFFHASRIALGIRFIKKPKKYRGDARLD